MLERSSSSVHWLAVLLLPFCANCLGHLSIQLLSFLCWHFGWMPIAFRTAFTVSKESRHRVESTYRCCCWLTGLGTCWRNDGMTHQSPRPCRGGEERGGIAHVNDSRASPWRASATPDALPATAFSRDVRMYTCTRIYHNEQNYMIRASHHYT